jgi:hypothetical protein
MLEACTEGQCFLNDSMARSGSDKDDQRRTPGFKGAAAADWNNQTAKAEMIYMSSTTWMKEGTM